MNTHGFSLTEVLVSLLLMTSTSLALLNQQWQVSQLFNQLQLHSQALTKLDNASEQLMAEQFLPIEGNRFQLTRSQTKQSNFLTITWPLLAVKNGSRSIQRFLAAS